MALADPKLVNFSLRGKSVGELRQLANSYLALGDSEIVEMDKTRLVSVLSEEAGNSTGLAKELRKSSICLKPSFYIVRISDTPKPPPAAIKDNIRRELQKSRFGLTELKLQLVDQINDGIFQLLFTWESSFNFWSPSFELSSVNQLQFGFGVVDYSVRKAIISCHTQKERDGLSKLLEKAFEVKFSSLVLTKPLLEQIGSFDRVTRAQYIVHKPDTITPANITYADEKLSARSMARDEEDNPRSQRQQSFYRVPLLNPLLEEGVGATSDSGKLWIPKEIPLEAVRDYCIALLGRISGTLDQMVRSKEIEAVLSTYKFDELPNLAQADPLAFRDALADLTRTVLIMLSQKEEERPYTLPVALALHCAPTFFFHPRIRLVDAETGDVSYWTDINTDTSQVKLSLSGSDLCAKSYLGEASLNLSDLRSPVTGEPVAVDDLLSALEFIPTEKFLAIIRDAIRRVSAQIPLLERVGQVSFRIVGNTLLLDVKRAFGDSISTPTLLTALDVVEFQQPMQRHQVSSHNRESVYAKLRMLGEKCVHMSDINCKTCVKDGNKICLRSLIGRYLKKTEILAHKNIELCDMIAHGEVNGKDRPMWGFAKLPSSKKEDLTLRNSRGAVLMAQIFAQIDRTTFKTVLIICPSIVNQDFQERAEILCNAFRKEVCFLDGQALGSLLLDYEEQNAIDKINTNDIYLYSKPNTAKKLKIATKKRADPVGAKKLKAAKQKAR